MRMLCINNNYISHCTFQGWQRPPKYLRWIICCCCFFFFVIGALPFQILHIATFITLSLCSSSRSITLALCVPLAFSLPSNPNQYKMIMLLQQQCWKNHFNWTFRWHLWLYCDDLFKNTAKYSTNWNTYILHSAQCICIVTHKQTHTDVLNNHN